MNDIKQNYERLIQNLELSEAVKEVMVKFLENYKGEYSEELNSLILALLISDSSNTKNRSKIEAFDEIISATESGLESVEKIEEQLTKLFEVTDNSTIG